MNIPWELIKPAFTQAAMDENGEVFVFTQEEISFIATGRYWCFNDLYVGKDITAVFCHKDQMNVHPENAVSTTS